MKTVLKVGGFAFSESRQESLVQQYVDLLKQLSKEHQLIVIAGGGAIARIYINAARKMGVPESLCDQLGIIVSRLNARLIADGLGEHAYPEIPLTVSELKHYFASGKIVAMGGLQPGHSTNAVAAIAAETVKAEIFVNATDVDGVYTSDPTKDPTAKRLEEVTVAELTKILSGGAVRAGTYDLMDPVALKVIERSRIPTTIVDGRTPINVLKAIRREKIGTRILFD
ncbi:MAG: UMP kinase [Candidatus Bathyarchaeia archaeon]